MFSSIACCWNHKLRSHVKAGDGGGRVWGVVNP